MISVDFNKSLLIFTCDYWQQEKANRILQHFLRSELPILDQIAVAPTVETWIFSFW